MSLASAKNSGQPAGDVHNLVTAIDDHDDHNVRLQLQHCHNPSDAVRHGIAGVARSGGRSQECKVWSRRDLLASTYTSTAKEGPGWEQVFARVTVEDQSGQIVESGLRSEIPRCQEHGRLDGGKSNIATYLLYVEDRFRCHR